MDTCQVNHDDDDDDDDDDDEKKMFSVFFFLNDLQVKFFCRIFEFCLKTFFIGEKSDFNFQNRRFFVKKNGPQIS